MHLVRRQGEHEGGDPGAHMPPFLDWELHWMALAGPQCAAEQVVPPIALGGASHVDHSVNSNL